MRPQFEAPRPRAEAKQLRKKPPEEAVEELSDNDFQPVSSTGIENLVAEFDETEWKEPTKKEVTKKKEVKKKWPAVPAERRRSDAADWAFGRVMPKDPGFVAEEDRKRKPLSPYVPVEPARPLSGLIEQEQAALSRRHAEMEARGHVYIDSPSAELTEEEMNAPTRRPADISSEPLSDRLSVPEQSEVRMKKSPIKSKEIVARGTYKEIQRPNPDTFIGRGTMKVTKNMASAEPSVWEDEEEHEDEAVPFSTRVIEFLTGKFGKETKTPRSGKRNAA